MSIMKGSEKILSNINVIQSDEIQKIVGIRYDYESDSIEVLVNDVWEIYDYANAKEWNALNLDNTIWTLSTTSNQSVTVENGSKITFVLTPNETIKTTKKVKKGTLSYTLANALSSYVKIQISYDGTNWITIGDTYDNVTLSYTLSSPAYIRISETYTTGHTVVFTKLEVK